MITALVLVWFLEWYAPSAGGSFDFRRAGPYLSEQECSAAAWDVFEQKAGVERMACVGRPATSPPVKESR